MSTFSYNHKTIENNWKDKWYKDNIYKAIDFSDKPKKYILAELPYPSGKSLHVGHMMRYTVPEIYSRFLRMNGYNVLFPMGWDCFGLPAETFAIKEGITPQEAIAKATVDYKKAMQDIGYAIDWDREITTSQPEYYKWTQLMFKRLWEKGLAIQEEMPVWWCKELGVLADEEVLPAKDGIGKISERGGYSVERKSFKQWVLNIPAYADRLIKDLDKTSYKESVKTGQINWIGRKEGAFITYPIDESDKAVTVFTTRPDTNFGATFITIAPENPLALEITTEEYKSQVTDYINKTKSKSDMERTMDNKEKTGVFTGAYALNRLNNTKLPIYISDYVLMNVGTGALVGVPAHDSRDFEFAKNFNIPIIQVVVKTKENKEKEITNIKDIFEEEGFNINSDFLNGLSTKEATEKIINYLEEKQWGQKAVTYKLRPQVFSRQRYWGEPIPLIHKNNGTVEALKDEQLPLELPIMKDFLPAEDGTSPLAKNIEWNTTVDSEGNTAKRETDTMPTWAGSNWYYMRYVDPKNDKAPADMEKLRYWMPIDMYFGDAGHTTAHLLYSRFWYKFLYDNGIVPHDEPYDFRMSGGMLLGPDGQKMSKSKGNVINPQEVLESEGADAVRTYLAFIGPYEDTYPWNPRGLNACSKLVKNIYLLKDIVKDTDVNQDKETQKLLHKTIKNMTEMMNELKMNTSVSEIMILVNHLKKQSTISKDIWKKVILLIAPFMPFTAEELWQEVNNYATWNSINSVHLQEWPKYNETLLVEDTINLPIQVNGKLRANIDINIETTEQDIKDMVLNLDNVKKYIDNQEIKKVIYIKGKVFNIVV